MRLFLPLLLLTDTRVEGGREKDSSYGIQVDKQERSPGIPGAPLVQVKGEGTQIKKETKSTNCSELLNSFSESSSSFTRCANQYARPIFICRNCLDDYLTVTDSFEALEHSAEEGVNCKDLLTSQDKVEIVKATFDYIAGKDGLWNRASCNSCYTHPLNHTSSLTETTVQFFALLGATQACFSAHPNQSLTQNKSEACTECQGDYEALNDFYREKVFSQFPLLSGICFDVLDAMNATQREWGSERFQCGRRMGSNTALLAAVFCIFLTPVIFYLTARFSQEAAGERTVVQRNHITDLIERARRQYNQYRRPSEPVRLVDADGGDSMRGSYYGESPERSGIVEAPRVEVDSGQENTMGCASDATNTRTGDNVVASIEGQRGGF